jgi:hypothetical protein
LRQNPWQRRPSAHAFRREHEMTQVFNNVGLAQLAAIAIVGLIVIAL